MNYDYPDFLKMKFELIREYNRNAKDKGNTWRDMKIGDLMIKVQEENDEVIECINDGLTDQLRSELLDSILVSIMLFERLSNNENI